MIFLNNNHHYFYKPQGALMKLMFSRMARQVSITLVGLFSPIYIYTVLTSKGYVQTSAIIYLLAFYFIVFFVKITTQFFSENLSRLIGYKQTMRLSAIPFLGFILSLNFAGLSQNLFIIAAVFWGIHSGLYWWGYHGYFIKKGEKEHFGSTIGEANLMESIAATVTPISGALIISYIGFSSLFVLSFLIVILSLLLLGKGSSTRQKHDIKPADILDLVGKHKLTAFAYAGMGAEAIIASVVWPLFLFLFFGKVISLGIIVTLAAVLASLFSVSIGSRVDIEGEAGIVRIGSIVLFSSWLIRFFSSSLGIFVVGDSLRNFGQRMVLLPLNTLSYKKAIETGSAKAVLFLETTIVIGVLSSLILLASAVYVGLDLRIAFLISGVFSLMPLIWAIRNKKK